MRRYLVIIEESAIRFSAFLPDLPACIVTVSSQELESLSFFRILSRRPLSM